jgi:hypothetical protein
MAHTVSLILALFWLLAAVVFFFLFGDRPELLLLVGIALLMSVFNWVKWWAQRRAWLARQRRDTPRGALEQTYQEGEPPPVQQ